MMSAILFQDTTGRDPATRPGPKNWSPTAPIASHGEGHQEPAKVLGFGEHPPGASSSSRDACLRVAFVHDLHGARANDTSAETHVPRHFEALARDERGGSIGKACFELIDELVVGRVKFHDGGRTGSIWGRHDLGCIVESIVVGPNAQ